MQTQNNQFSYPVTRRDDTIDDHQLPDPYRWLENPDTEETKNWVTDQNKVTSQYLDSYPHKQELRQKLTDIYNYEKYGAPYKRGENYYYSKNSGLQNQSVIYTMKNLDDAPQLFFDPNNLSSDGTTSLGSSSFSEDGKIWAYSTSIGGSDWRTIYFKNVETLQDKPDKINFVKFSGIQWTHDNKGVFYSRYPKPKEIESTETNKAGTETDSNKNHQVYYHKLGTQQEEDILIFENPNAPENNFSGEVSDDGKYLILTHHFGCSVDNKVYYSSLENFPETPVNFTKLVDTFESMFSFIDNVGSNFFFLSNADGAKKNKVISIDINNPAQENWKDVIPETNDVLESALVVNQNQLLIEYNKDVHSVMYLYDLQGNFLKEIPTPTIGTVGIRPPRKEDKDLFFIFTSFLYPSAIYKYNFDSEKLELFKSPKIQGFNPDEFETRQEFYESKDGTKIPMFIVSSKDTFKSGAKPVFLYGYGGFNISIQPHFSPFRIILMKNLGINLAIANIRGGGEYGQDWHKAGTKEKKQNVFDDFQSAAQYLIDKKYSTSQQIIISGGSNGGLLVGACVNQRPDLFRCGVAQVGVLDMLRFHKFTIGHAWCTDYGCADNKEDFNYLIKYSPLHNVNKAGVGYPSVLLTTGDHDDRVVPLHSYKYISELQHQLSDKQYQKNPLMIRIETNVGHGAGKPTEKIIDEIADIYGFMSLSIGVQWNNQ